MKTPILKTIKNWSPKQKKARVKKQKLVFSKTRKEIIYKEWFGENNS